MPTTQKIQLKRTKNSWIPFKGNFCTPFITWELEIEAVGQFLTTDSTRRIASYLLEDSAIDPQRFSEVHSLLALTAARLQSCGSNYIFLWLMELSSRQPSKNFCYPFLDEKVAASIGPLIIEFILKANTILNVQTGTPLSATELPNLLSFYRRQLNQLIPYPSSLRLLVEATNRCIPSRRYSDLPSYQLGYGSQRKFFYRGYTSHTSQMASAIATHKHLASQALRDAGLPTPKHFVVGNLEEAITAARRLGYPVVMKPTSTDKGVGVTVDIQNEDELRLAWPIASPYGLVLVEEMIKGFDHRLHIIDGKCRYVTRRTPPYVCGDGHSTVKELINIHAEIRSRDPEYNHFPCVSATDRAVVEYLEKQGLSLATVLPASQVVYLRSNANVSTGGLAEEVTSQCHPENRLLAECAARLIGLDNAGVDFITADIHAPWTTSGGKITEINPTPAFGKEIAYGALVDYLYPVKTPKQIPLLLFVGEFEVVRAHLKLAEERLKTNKKTHACLANQQLSVTSHSGTLRIPGKSTQELVIIMLSDPVVECGLIQLTVKELDLGLDINYLDLLVLLGAPSETSNVLNSDIVCRCERRNVLINPSIDQYLAALEALRLA